MKQRAQRVKTRHIILAVMCLMYFISYKPLKFIFCNIINGL